MRTPKLTWINENPGCQADERGYWVTLEGRFRIHPNYRHTIYPDDYTVRDTVKHIEETNYSIRDCKEWALRICLNEVDNETHQIG